MPLTDEVAVVSRGDIGGFGARDFDYESGSRADAVSTKLDFRGPALGLVFDF